MQKINLEERIGNLADEKNRIKSFQGFCQIEFDDDLTDNQIESFNEYLYDNAEIIINFNGTKNDLFIGIARIANILKDMELGIDRKYHNLEYAIVDYDDIYMLINRNDLRSYEIDDKLLGSIALHEIE